MAEDPLPVCCPECGAVLVSGRLDGLCPVCLLDETEVPFAEKPPKAESSGPGLLHLPGYRIIREIARGGMGIIYEAEQAEPQRRVAVKMLLPHLLEDPGMRERFRSEVQAMAGLDHPGILPVYEVGDYNGLPYFTMKLAPGGNLAKNSGRFTGDWRAIATLMAHLADAIQTAHDHGVLHRDLKPGNILFDERDRASVSDFGIAKRLHQLEGAHELTNTATMLGTPNYLPPEWASGSAKRATTAGDIYGLGAILYELLTGDPPHVDTHLTALLRRISDEPVADPRGVNPAIPRDLRTICLKAVRKEPMDRYHSASALAQDLRNWLGGRPIVARSVGRMEKVWRWAIRNPLPATLAVLLGMALTLGGAALGKALHTSRRNLHSALLAQAGALRESGRLGKREEILTALQAAAAIERSPAVREEYISALAMTGLAETRKITYNARRNPSPAEEKIQTRVCTDESLTCYTHRDAHGILTIRRLDDDRIISSVTGSGIDPAGVGPFSPDGRYLLARPVKTSGADQNMPMHVWDVGGGTWKKKNISCLFACFAPDSHTLALGSLDGTVTLLDLLTDTLTGPFRTGFGKKARPYCFSPDGKKLMVGEYRTSRFVILDTATGGIFMDAEHPESAHVRCATWRPDSLSCFIGTENFKIYEWQMIPKSLPRQYIGHRANVLTVELNRSGDSMISQSDDGTTRLWSVGSAQTVATIPCTGTEARFSPDGSRFICQDRDMRQLREFKLESSEVCKEFSVPLPLTDETSFSGCWRITFSPDGGLLTVGDLDGLLHFDGITGVPAGKSPVGSCWSLQWAPDGSRLFSAGDAGLQIWPARTQADGISKLLPPLPGWIGPGNKLTLNHCSLSGDGRSLAVGRRTYLELYETASGRQTASIGYVESGVDAVASNRDGSLVAASQNTSGIRVWDTVTRTELPMISTHFPEGSVLFGAEKDLLFVGTKDEVSSWNARTGQNHWRIDFATRSSIQARLAFPADFSVLAANLTEDSVSLLDPTTMREITRLRRASPHPVSALAFSPDGTRLAVLCSGHIIQLWDLQALRRKLAEQQLDWPGPHATASPAHTWRLGG